MVANDGYDDSNVITVNVAITDNIYELITVPGQPDAPSVSGASDASLSVSWVKPSVTGHPDVTDYDVRYCPTASNCDHKQDDRDNDNVGADGRRPSSQRHVHDHWRPADQYGVRGRGKRAKARIGVRER